MKLRKRITAAALSAVMLLSVAVTGADAATLGEPLSFQPTPGAVTVVTDTSGRQTTYDGILDVCRSENSAAIAGVASYELCYQGKSVLEVTLNDIQSADAVAASSAKLNGYYAVNIDDLTGNQSAFITGLSPSNVQAVQDGLISACAKDKTFELESLDFIDAEKTGIEDKDLYQCWAATSANILTYTGWAQAAGFKDEDDMFEAFVNNFNDDGSIFLYAMAWFFNGVSGVSEEDPFGVPALPKKGTGGYFKDYAYDQICQSYDFTEEGNAINAMQQLQKALRDGSGVMMSVSLGIFGGHALSCWGYVVDNDFDENDKAHYTRLLYSDSDSDMSDKKDRRTAPDKMHSMTLEPFELIDDSYGLPLKFETWTCQDYDDAFLGDFSVLPSVKDTSVPKETSLRATKNKRNTVDFVSTGFFVGQKEDEYDCIDSIYPVPDNRDIYLAGTWMNLSDKYYDGSCKCTLTVTDSDGNTVAEKTVDTQKDEYEYESGWNAYAEARTETVNIGRLSAGTYTVTMTANPEKSVREAYYYNNTYSETFTVSKALPNADKLSVTLSNPRADDDMVLYDLQFSGLTEQQLADVVSCELYEIRDTTDEEDESYTYPTYGEPVYENEDDVLPVGCRVWNQYPFSLLVKLQIKGNPPVFLETEKFKPDLPEITIERTDDESIIWDEDLTPVEANAISFANGESLNYILKNTSSEAHGAVSGTYYLQAQNVRTDEKIMLTKPVAFNLKRNKTKNVSFSKFDTPLPQGEYELNLVLEGDFVKCDDNYEIYLRAGKREDPDEYYPGDVDLDGELTINDATLLQKYLADMVELDPTQLWVSDVYMDDKVNIDDVSYIQKILAE